MHLLSNHFQMKSLTFPPKLNPIFNIIQYILMIHFY
nr:MAG TPA_asm: hypothetical protein [Caudoviricetes sp.]